jgi:hypothetical protein
LRKKNSFGSPTPPAMAARGSPATTEYPEPASEVRSALFSAPEYLAALEDGDVDGVT